MKRLMCAIGILTVGMFTFADSAFSNQNTSWILSDDQRRAFLHYYSPIILKRADENKIKGKTRGHDWITNFNFDQDGNFSNNRKNWEKEKRKFIDRKGHANWKIQPTLYTAAIEFMQNDQKSLILLYHVYHAMQGCQKLEQVICKNEDIHDWERIEIRLNHVTDTGPGQGEAIGYYVLTAHSKHTGRLGGHPDLHYLENMNTPQSLAGKHLFIWQAKWRGSTGPRKGELRFVEDDLDEFLNGRAKVDISGHDDKPFHYVFVDRDAKDATAFWNAQHITAENAANLASGKDDDKVIKTKKTKRITYELQDLADVFPTHWIHANGTESNIHWTGTPVHIELAEPIQSSITGTTIKVPAGLQDFYQRSLDGSEEGERTGYPRKHWFWGTYFWGNKGKWTRDAYEARGEVWNQHDYFAHEGSDNLRSKPSPEHEVGEWLPEGWHKAENGGFDGRWVPLFSE
ncbi:MAG: hypothetical protein NPIRA02_37730 [Nitrospirales bacterium]|nr:MAG: hypothetical protein NPIRA02_37730 [Nitrospirales bacterium]